LQLLHQDYEQDTAERKRQRAAGIPTDANLVTYKDCLHTALVRQLERQIRERDAGSAG
jgi:hypothetical protein